MFKSFPSVVSFLETGMRRHVQVRAHELSGEGLRREVQVAVAAAAKWKQQEARLKHNAKQLLSSHQRLVTQADDAASRAAAFDAEAEAAFKRSDFTRVEDLKLLAGVQRNRASHLSAQMEVVRLQQEQVACEAEAVGRELLAMCEHADQLELSRRQLEIAAVNMKASRCAWLRLSASLFFYLTSVILCQSTYILEQFIPTPNAHVLHSAAVDEAILLQRRTSHKGFQSKQAVTVFKALIKRFRVLSSHSIFLVQYRKLILSATLYFIGIKTSLVLNYS